VEDLGGTGSEVQRARELRMRGPATPEVEYSPDSEGEVPAR